MCSPVFVLPKTNLERSYYKSMRKKITMKNSEIKPIAEAFNVFKSHNNLVCMPSITMAAIKNVRILTEELKDLAECEGLIRDKYFTDETSTVDEKGVRTLKESCKEEVLTHIIEDMNELMNRTVEIELEAIRYSDFEKLMQRNADTEVLTPLELTVLDLIAEEV